MLLPGIVGNDAFISRLNATEAAPAWQVRPPTLTDGQFEHLLNARRIRRMSAYTKYMLAAATIACGDAKLSDQPELLAASCGSARHGPRVGHLLQRLLRPDRS